MQYKNPIELLTKSGMPAEVILEQPGLYMNMFTSRRLIFLHKLYQMILNVQGCVMEFGVRWGQDLIWWHNQRAIYEVHMGRQIIGFDTWEGFPSVHAYDGDHAVGELAVVDGYEAYLDHLMRMHEQTVYPGAKYFALIKGDVIETVPRYLSEHPSTVIALAYFDLDLYEPTKVCLEAIGPYLTKGSILGFDEAGHTDWPGETRAIREVLGTRNIRLLRSVDSGTMSYCVVE